MDRHSDLSLPGRIKPYVMAHRGNRVACPENTMASFRRAIVDGADIIETDLHLSADGVIVCIHDATLDRTTDGHGPVAEKTLAELKIIHASYNRPEFVQEHIPTLEELAAFLPNDVALALELKSDAFLRPEICLKMVACLDKTGVRDRTVALSFSLERLMTVREVAPDIPIGWITLTRAWPRRGVDLIGPFWPLLILNPLYVWLAHKQRQIICPLDPTPDRRLWFYRLVNCDAILTDDPGETCRAMGRDPGSSSVPQALE
jgi:glycerophosphoryl diester phosphodiesterase